jgi:hypothetical protein
MRYWAKIPGTKANQASHHTPYGGKDNNNITPLSADKRIPGIKRTRLDWSLTELVLFSIGSSIFIL